MMTAGEMLGRLGLWLTLHGSIRVEMFDMPVFVPYRPGQRRDRAVENLRTALAYLARYAPATLARASRDLRGILIWPVPAGAPGSYDERSGLCLVDADVAIEPEHPVRLALLIAHEAMHARLRACPYGTPDERVRIERLCVKAEILVASRIPGGERTAQLLPSRLDALVPRAYTDAAICRRILADPRRRRLWQLIIGRGRARASRPDA